MHSIPPKRSRLIPLGLALTVASVARADYAPIALTSGSYNQDMVVEKTARTPVMPGGYTTATVDYGIANTVFAWYEVGYNTGSGAEMTGLPAAGSTFTSAADSLHQYKMAPSYLSNNTIMLDSGYFTNTYSLTLKTPAAYAALSFLTSGGYGGCVFNFVAHHQEGTTSSGQVASVDWFNGGAAAVVANGRVDAQNFGFGNVNSGFPKLFSKDASLQNTTSPITNLDLSFASGNASGHTCIMAVSGAATAGGLFTPIEVTGYNADVVVEASAPHPGPLSGLTTATVDNGTNNNNNTFYEAGYNPFAPATGLPAAGSSLTNAAAPDHRYVLAPSYAANNVVFVDPANSNATITLATPASYSALSFLTAAGNGPGRTEVVINHQDGSAETNLLVSPD